MNMNQDLVMRSIELYNNGLSYEKISRLVGKSKKWVMVKLKGKIIPRPAKRNSVIYERIFWSTLAERDNLIFSLYEKHGASIIAKKLGICKKLVFKILGDKVDKNRRNILLTTEMINKINKLYDDGMSMTQIADKFNVTNSAIKYHLKHTRASYDALRIFPVSLHDQICKLYNDGMSTYDLSDWLLQQGIKAHPNSLSSFLQRKKLIRTHEQARLISTKKRSNRLIPSKLENKVGMILDLMGIEYEKQFALNNWVYDFKINNWLLEVQGDYFHKLPGRPNRDLKKFRNAINNNYKMLYLWEHEILERPQLVLDRLKNKLFNNNLEINLNELSISNINWDIASEFLDKYHYQKRGRSGINFGLFYNNTLIAVCIFASIIRMEVSIKQGLTPSQMLELSRLCIDPKYQIKNLASYFISRCRKLIHLENQNIKCLVAFSDLSYGHNGAIYKADNWTYDGLTDPSYWYIDNKRNIIHKKTVWNAAKKAGISESDYSSKNNLRKVNGLSKLRFLYKF